MICVKLGGEAEIEVRIDPKVPAEVAQRICDAVLLLQQRIVSEEDAAEALEFLEEAASAEESPGSCHSVAQLCLAEAYISGAVPQSGVDHRRAFKALLAFHQSIGTNDLYENFSPHVINALSRIAMELPGIELSVHTDALVDIAEHVPGIQGVALRACLYRPRLAQDESGALVPKTDKPLPVREEALLESILHQLASADQDRAVLHAGAKRLREENVLLSGALEDERRKTRLLEEMVRQSTETNGQLKFINSELSHRLDQSEAMGLALRVEVEHQHSQVDIVSEELRSECRKFREEIAEREKMCVELHAKLGREREVQSNETDQLHRQLAACGELCRALEAKLQDERAAQIAHFEHPQEPQLPPLGRVLTSTLKEHHKGRTSDVHLDCEEVLSHLLQRQALDNAYDGYNREILEEAAKQAAFVCKETCQSRGSSASFRATMSTSTTRSATPISTYDVDLWM